MRAVFPGLKPEDGHKLTRANERLVMIREVEASASKLDELEEKARKIQAA